MGRKGRGWHGEASRHSAAAKRGHGKRMRPFAAPTGEMTGVEREQAQEHFRELRSRMKEIKGGKLYKLSPPEQKEYDNLFSESWDLYLRLH